jgi:hypothetical protein
MVDEDKPSLMDKKIELEKNIGNIYIKIKFQISSFKF